VQTLARWRVHGQGPLYLKYGRLVRYRHEDLESWASEQQRVHTSAPATRRVVTLRRPEQEP